ncbi:hypothetical protein FRC17_008880 [Serendipita sp. 399]|nr:hypothetical protein FRC17_008880 [Serendipita sp. 399]
MVLRFLQGWGAGPASTVGLQMLQDIYSELERGEKIGYWTASIDLGLLFGPLLGGFAAIPSYAWPAWLTAILFGILLLSMIFIMPETAHSAYIDGFSAQFLNFKQLPKSQKTRVWTTTVNCMRLFAYPKVLVYHVPDYNDTGCFPILVSRQARPLVPRAYNRHGSRRSSLFRTPLRLFGI